MACTAALAAGAVAGQAADETVPLQALFDRPSIGDVALSPSGRWLAATVPGPNKGRQELVIADLSRSPLEFKPTAWLKDYDVASIDWLNDKRLVFTGFDSQAGAWSGVTGLWAVDIDGNDNRLLIDPYWWGFRAVQPTSRVILSADWAFFDTPKDGSDDVLVVRRGWSSLQSRVTYALFRLDTRQPRPHRLDENAPEGTDEWIFDAEGRVQWLTAIQDGQRRVYRRQGAESWSEVARSDALKGMRWSPRFVLDGQLFVAAEPAQGRGSRLHAWDGERSRPAEPPVLRAEGFDVGDDAQPLIDRASRQPLGWRYRLDATYTRWTDEAMAAAQAAIDRALPGRINEIRCSACLGAERWLVVSWSDRRPVQFAVFERSTGRLLPLGSAHPEVPESGLGGRSFHRIRSRDGEDLPLYVTRPVQDLAQARPRARPVVVYVHGGPASRTTLEWDGDAVPQFLASRGYLVIEPDFRGSTGYGSVHRHAGLGQWGLAMQDDLRDALDWAVAQGLADGRRACIMGASYGGYAALMGPARDPGAYRCAIAWLAPTDLPRLVEETNELFPMNRLPEQAMARQIGADARRRSPLSVVGEIKVPVLAAWGVEDRRVPIGHGRDWRDAARAAQLDLEYVEYAGEGHGWLLPETRLDFFGRVERLLRRTLGEP